MTRKTWKWQPETRNAILANCNGRCVACGCADEAVLQIDHIIPAGPTTVGNGQAMCGPCNRAKADVRSHVELAAFQPIDPASTMGEYLTAMTSLRASFAGHMADLRQQEDADLLDWARAEIGRGRRVASVIRTLARTHNGRVSKRVARSL